MWLKIKTGNPVVYGSISPFFGKFTADRMTISPETDNSEKGSSFFAR